MKGKDELELILLKLTVLQHLFFMVHVPGTTIAYVYSLSYFSFCYKIVYYFFQTYFGFTLCFSHTITFFFSHYEADIIFCLDMD